GRRARRGRPCGRPRWRGRRAAPGGGGGRASAGHRLGGGAGEERVGAAVLGGAMGGGLLVVLAAEPEEVGGGVARVACSALGAHVMIGHADSWSRQVVRWRGRAVRAPGATNTRAAARPLV